MPADRNLDLHFPKAGIDVSQKAGEWPRRVGPQGETHYTCADALNVRGFDALTRRHRGGSRPGLSRWVAAKPANYLIQDLFCLVGTGFTAPGGGMQGSNSGRVVTVVAVAAGNVYVANPGDSAWTSPTNNAVNTPPLNVSGVVFSAPNLQKLYFADGLVDRVYYDPSTNVVDDWTTTAGTMPADGANAPRLICLWRGRTCQSGITTDPQNIFMSAVGLPRNYDYSPASPSATDAVALNLSDVGEIGDVVTGLVPSTDDVLVVLCDHTIHKITGDPLAGGQRDLVCDGIGAAWGQAWCKDPAGTIYFFSNVPGVYAMPAMAAGQPQRISHAIDPLLEDIDTGANTIRLIWDDRYKGFHVFVTPNTVAAEADDVTHYFWEAPRPDGSGGAWWKDRFADPNMNPLCCCTADGNEAGDRVSLIGSFDGYVRAVDSDAADDDGTDIESMVLVGPFLTPDFDEVKLKSVQGVFADGSADVDYQLLLGRTAEEALSDTTATAAPRIGTFSALRGYTKRVNRAAHALYLRLESTGRWAMESIRAAFDSKTSKVRQRGKR